jgi:polygalacturonase
MTVILQVLSFALLIALQLPVLFAWHVVSVDDFGAVGDNHTDNTAAFRAALLAVAGGGEVFVPASGVYQTAPFNLTSNVALHVEGVVRGVTNRSAFPIIGPLPSYGTDLDTGGHARRQPLIFSVGASNVSVFGGGLIDVSQKFGPRETKSVVSHSLLPLFRAPDGTGTPSSTTEA